MKIIPIAVPTPFYVGDVNVYLVKDDPITLIDVGPKTPAAAEALERGLAANGVRPEDIRRIVLTHAHEDHCGLAKSVRDRAKNADIFVHNWETGHLFGRLAHDEHSQLMRRAGVADHEFRQMQELYEEMGQFSDPLDAEDLLPLVDGQELEFGSGTLRVIHTPGHTPGSCSFIREADRTIVCGDCVLKRITPNPVLSVDPVDPTRRFRSLGEYLVSLARLRSLSPTLVYGGHGEPVTDFEEIFHRYVRSIDDRQRKVIGLVPKDGITAFETAKLLFQRSFDQDVHRFLAISEAAAHLDHAFFEGRIGMREADGVDIYFR